MKRIQTQIEINPEQFYDMDKNPIMSHAYLKEIIKRKHVEAISAEIFNTEYFDYVEIVDRESFHSKTISTIHLISGSELEKIRGVLKFIHGYSKDPEIKMRIEQLKDLIYNEH